MLQVSWSWGAIDRSFAMPLLRGFETVRCLLFSLIDLHGFRGFDFDAKGVENAPDCGMNETYADADYNGVKGIGHEIGSERMQSCCAKRRNSCNELV